MRPTLNNYSRPNSIKNSSFLNPVDTQFNKAEMQSISSCKSNQLYNRHVKTKSINDMHKRRGSLLSASPLSAINEDHNKIKHRDNQSNTNIELPTLE